PSLTVCASPSLLSSLPLPPPPLTPPLFPYTTLFRSKIVRIRRRVIVRDSVIRLRRFQNQRNSLRPSIREQPLEWLDADLTVSHQDRKSTRLNSSHVSISYAVFCLKKKKTSSLLRTAT